MCGLYASVGFPPDPARIDAVAHRGPDGRGWAEFASPAGPVALGHRRLAIIDLTPGGHQPMADASGRLHLTFNGEVYNYVELREELRARGESFTTDSDSEVLLVAYRVWGEACLARLRGMFAFVIWDARERVLFAARDRFGIKPLYVVEHPSGVAFASEIKQVLGLPGADPAVNAPRARNFLAAGISDHTDETMFAGVRQVRAGECARVDCAGGAPRLTARRWYAIPRGRVEMAPAAAATRFRALLDDAVRLHLRADVTVGSCLSGGLDSSSIVGLAARRLGSESGGPRLTTVSACYAEKEVDERPFMEAVERSAPSDPVRVFPRPEDLLARASDVTWHQDEPYGSTSILAQWAVFEAAKGAGVKVMLDGQGADEPLAGYHWTAPHHLAGAVRRGEAREALAVLRGRRRLHGEGVAGQLARALLLSLPAGAARALRARRRRAQGHTWLRGAGAPSGADVMEEARLALGLPRASDLDSVCLSMTFASNLQMLLHWEDRNSMAHSIEARVPFLDHPLVEFALALGNHHKMEGATTKAVLRRAMADVLPPAVRDRQDKLGFATPEAAWFRGPLRGAVHDGVELALRRFPALLDASATRAFRDAALGGAGPMDFTLWRIVSLGLWGERFGVGA